MKIRNRSRVSGVISATESESERFHFLPTPLPTPSLTFRLWSSENQIVRVGSRSGRISQSECSFPRFVIGLVLLLLLPTPTIWFSQDHKRNVSDGVVSGIGTLFSLDHKLYASDYDSDSVAKWKPALKDRSSGNENDSRPQSPSQYRTCRKSELSSGVENEHRGLSYCCKKRICFSYFEFTFVNVLIWLH